MKLMQLQQQTQKLKMTAELRQAISILQFSSQELTHFIREQAMENPVIELRDREPKITANHLRGNQPKGRKRTVDPMGLIADVETGLRDDLLQQARCLSIENVLFEMISYLILQLDDDGYLRDDIEVISRELNQPFETVMKALKILQSLEPAGIGARNLEECLLLQLSPEDQLSRAIITNHLVEMARGNLESIQEQLSVPMKAIETSVVLIQSLNPKPGSAVTKDRPEYIRPDLVVDKTVNGYDIWIVENGVPAISVNREYDHLITSSEKNEATIYIQNKYKQYLWLIKSIEQRQTTLLNVANTIMNHQQRFLEWGPKAMAPLTLKEIADELDIHESTVSRAVKQKYVQTPFGIFELKAFFTSKVKTEGFSDISSMSVKILIQEIVESEDQRSPLSDQNIVDVLKDTKGINISRRAVTKYRTALKIPSSSQRKKWPIRR